MIKIKKYSKLLLLLLNLFILTGCQIVDKNGLTRNLYSSLKDLSVNSIDFIYPFLGFVGLIMLAIGIYTLFLKPTSPNETFANNLISGIFELFIAVILITAKQLVDYWFKTT